MFVKTREFLASCLKLFLAFSQESIRKLYDLSLSPTLTERSPVASGSRWFPPRVTQKSYHFLTPSAGVPAKLILSSRLLFGYRTIVLLDLIILFGRWSKLSNQRLCGIMVKDTDNGATLLEFKAWLCYCIAMRQ